MIRSPASSASEVRAHGGEVTDIAIQCNAESDPLIATCSRDRMVQVFWKVENTLELVQTLEDHVGAVNHVLFASEGEKLLSCSGDRTVMVREKVTRDDGGKTSIAYFPLQVVTLKASPVSMVLLPEDPDLILISTIDRHILKYNISDGHHLHSWKPSDSDSNAVVLGSMNISRDNSNDHPRVLVGVSTTDKAVRVYDFDRDNLLCREFGHTEGVTGVVLLEPKDTSKKTLISTGLDGIVIIWSLTMQVEQEVTQQPTPSDEAQISKELTSTKTPLRRIISMSKLAEFSKLDGSPLPITPTRDQSPPRLRRKTSRFTLGPQFPKITPSPIPSLQPSKQSPTTERLRGRSERSPSPPSPRTKTTRTPRPSVEVRSRTKSYTNANDIGSLQNSASQLCKSLRSHRRRLNTSTTMDHLESTAELSRELELTLKALGRKSEKVRANSDSEVRSMSVTRPQGEPLANREGEKPPEQTPTTMLDSPVEQKHTTTPDGSEEQSLEPASTPKGSTSAENENGTETTESPSQQDSTSQIDNTESVSTQSETDIRTKEKETPVQPKGTPPKSTVAMLRAKLESSSSTGSAKSVSIPRTLDPDGEG
jgi:hypothetical protein